MLWRQVSQDGAPIAHLTPALSQPEFYRDECLCSVLTARRRPRREHHASARRGGPLPAARHVAHRCVSSLCSPRQAPHWFATLGEEALLAQVYQSTLERRVPAVPKCADMSDSDSESLPPSLRGPTPGAYTPPQQQIELHQVMSGPRDASYNAASAPAAGVYVLSAPAVAAESAAASPGHGDASAPIKSAPDRQSPSPPVQQSPFETAKAQAVVKRPSMEATVAAAAARMSRKGSGGVTSGRLGSLGHTSRELHHPQMTKVTRSHSESHLPCPHTSAHTHTNIDMQLHTHMNVLLPVTWRRYSVCVCVCVCVCVQTLRPSCWRSPHSSWCCGLKTCPAGLTWAT